MRLLLRILLRFVRYDPGCVIDQLIRYCVGVVPAADRDAVANPLANCVLRECHRPFFFTGLAKRLP